MPFLRQLRPIVFLAAALVGASACVTESPQQEVSFPLSATSKLAAQLEVGGVRYEIESATMAFGPVYFCAAATGSTDLCSVASGEWRGVKQLDLMASDNVSLGQVQALSGEVRSASFDLGLSWFSTDSNVVVSSAAPEKHSVAIQGFVSRNTRRKRFKILVDFVPANQAQRAVPTLPMTATFQLETKLARVIFEPERWLAALDWSLVWESSEEELLVTPSSPLAGQFVAALKLNAPPQFVVQ